VPDEFAGHSALYDTMVEHIDGLVITHEADPDWRKAVLTNRPSLLALRFYSHSITILIILV